MNLTPTVLLKQITEFWKKQNRKMKMIIISSLLGFTMVAILIAALLNHENFVVLYRGLSSSEAGEILTQLDKMGEKAKTQDDGTILVPEENEARLKMLLSSEGYPKTALDYDIFTNSSNLMTTDYEKKKYLIFQLQNRLQDAIETVSGVNSAIVTISVPDDSSFVLEEDKVPVTASVLLNLRGSSGLDKRQIKGIEELVAKSVPGLKASDVAIVDDTGATLNETDAQDGTITSDSKMELEKNISQTVKDRIINLLLPVFGRNRISVAVSTNVDVNKKVSEQTTYTPVIDQGGIIAKQDQAKEGTSGNNGTATGIPGTGSNTGVPTYQTQSSGSTSGSSNESSSTDYLVNQLKEQVQRDGYEIKDLSVAVIIGDTSLSQNELDNYRQMVAYAAGINTDKVLISDAEFADQKDNNNSTPARALFPDLLKNPIYLFAGIGCILLFIIIFSIAKKLKRRKEKKKEQIDMLEEAGLDIQTALEEKPKVDLPGEIVLNETREQGLKKQIKDFSSSNPDIVAQLLRTWIKEDED
ncbi:MAG: flagellar basal-body MS-ring/collar protein FliF [Clostridiales bacterium]|nr:flagellar basal-body MS-ring/collar protein FliF [Clostridiales bacterium]